jgi:WD40 repeat protein
LVDHNKIKSSNSQIALCGISVDANKIALGFKDGTIEIVSTDGQPVCTLREHKASICTLSLLKLKGKTYLASGSDIGCSRVILWDTNTWQPL